MGRPRKEGSLKVEQIRELERSAQLAVQSGESIPRKRARPAKVAVSLRLDADVVAWLKSDGRGYGTRANRILRERMAGESHSGKAL